MTDEERQGIYKLIPVPTCAEAAEEIEWLSKKRLEAAHGYASECEDRIKMLNDQIDAIMSALKERND